MMDDQRDALITSVNNPLLLAQKIEQLLFQPDVRQMLRGALRENVENLTWETTANALIEIYQDLIILQSSISEAS